jgi:hypothetical protein
MALSGRLSEPKSVDRSSPPELLVLVPTMSPTLPELSDAGCQAKRAVEKRAERKRVAGKGDANPESPVVVPSIWLRVCWGLRSG